MGAPVFTPEDDKIIGQAYQELGPNWKAIHKRVGKGTVRSVSQRFYDYVKPNIPESVPTLNGNPCEGISALTTFDNPIRPLRLPKIEKAEKKKRNGGIVGMLCGDEHFPFQDQPALDCVLSITRQLKPDVIALMGDLLDCYGLSDFDKDPKRINTLQDEINQGRFHLAEMRKASPDSKIYLFDSNHFDRMRRTLWRMAGPSGELRTLTAFQEAMTWPTLLNLEELDITWVPLNHQTRTEIFPKFIVKHGDRVRIRSGYTAHAEHARYGRSGASGHTHRLAAVWHRDHNGNHVWCETGCLCDLNPEYAQDPDWQQGCVVVSFEEHTSAISVEPIYIQNGLAQWRGKTIRAQQDG
jgi:hypothetical protein